MLYARDELASILIEYGIFSLYYALFFSLRFHFRRGHCNFCGFSERILVP